MSFSVTANGILCDCKVTDEEVYFNYANDAVRIKTEDIIGCEVVSTSWFFDRPALNLWHIEQKDGNFLTQAKVQITEEEDVWRKLEKEIQDKLKKHYSQIVCSAYENSCSFSIKQKLNSCADPEFFLEETCVGKRPKSLLVLINPIGGNKTGLKDYKNTVSPVFSLAKIDCDVIVSERKNHMIDVATKYDTSTIDGIVILGGDGSFTEVASVLIRKVQQESGVDYNDPRAKLKPLTLPITMIPTGSNNYVAAKANGCRDVLTTALHVIRGQITPMNIIGVYADGKLLDYAGSSAANGLSAEFLYLADIKYRWLGRLRLFALPVRFLLLREPIKIYNCEVTCYTGDTVQNEGLKEGTGHEEVVVNGRTIQNAKLKAKTKDSVTFEGEFACLSPFNSNIINQEEEKIDFKNLHRHPKNVISFVLYNEKITFFSLAKQIQQVVTQLDGPIDDFYDLVHAQGVKVTLTDKDKGDGSDDELIKHLLHIDGEIFEMKDLEYQVWLHENIVPVFTSFNE